MRMFFLDESGTAPNKPGAQKYFVLGGVIMADHEWFPIRRKFEKLKNLYRVEGEIKWRHFGHRENTKGPLHHLSKEKSDEFREEIFKIITDASNVRVISVVIDIEEAFKLPGVNCSDDLYEYAYKPASERFQYHLQDLSVKTREYGVVVCDHRNSKNDKRLRKLHHDLMHSRRSENITYKNIIEGLFLAPSDQSIGIQLADMVAGACFRYFEKNDLRHISKLIPKFRQCTNGLIEGYGIVCYPKKTFGHKKDAMVIPHANCKPFS